MFVSKHSSFYCFVSVPSFSFFIEPSIFCMVSLRHFSRYSSQDIHLFTSLSLFHFINRTAHPLVRSSSFPDVKGALAPTVTASFVNAAPTIWWIKKSTCTHKTYSSIIYAELDFCLPLARALGAFEIYCSETVMRFRLRLPRISLFMREFSFPLLACPKRVTFQFSMRALITDGLSVISDVTENNKIVAGGGAIEIEIAKGLRNYSTKVGGKQQLAVEAFADAVEVIPRTLAENGGSESIDLLIELRQVHDSARTHSNYIRNGTKGDSELGCINALNAAINLGNFSRKIRCNLFWAHTRVV